MNLFDFSLRLNGYPLQKAKAELSMIQQKNDKSFEAFVKEKRQGIVKHHIANNAFYQSLVGERDSNNWKDLPILTKRHLQQPLEERISKGFHMKNVYVNKTSGSSGDPFIFAKDKFCHAMTWAVIQNRFGWYDLNFNTSRQARFYGIPLDKKGYYKERLKDGLSKRFRFSVFDLSDATFEAHLKKFKTASFDYINGYTSAIVQFAKFLKRHHIQLTAICPSLKACIVTSEMLFEQDKLLLEQVFGVPVINEYGASELDLIAFQNPSHQWQVNSETLYVEILDDEDRVLPYGEEGRIIITSLYNRAHPFIRYDIGDIGVLSKDSTLRMPILEKLTGRTNDMAILPSGKKAAGLTFYYITKSIIEDDGHVKEFIIEQKEKYLFHVTYVSNKELTEAKKATIVEEMTNYLEKGLTITFERQEQLKRSKSGKLKQFSSRVSQETYE
ncbi:MAG: phenylacetate--CoA ligase family protein [Algicola sp.]|nr:phenylacetate--CoA ligase family protein [Algicola sp.]